MFIGFSEEKIVHSSKNTECFSSTSCLPNRISIKIFFGLFGKRRWIRKLYDLESGPGSWINVPGFTPQNWSTKTMPYSTVDECCGFGFEPRRSFWCLLLLSTSKYGNFHKLGFQIALLNIFNCIISWKLFVLFLYFSLTAVLRIRDIRVFCVLLFKSTINSRSFFKEEKSYRSSKTIGIKVFLTLFAWW